jgi:hypothetical protein
MARARSPGNGRLEDALTRLIQSQASLAETQAAFLARLAETDREILALRRESAERFARIEAILLDHNRILSEHNQRIQALTDAVREKIGFRAPPSAP